MKKIISLALALIIICAFAGCAPNNITSSGSTVDETKPTEQVQVNIDNYDKTYDGFCKYLVDSKTVGENVTEMQANLIGAQKGNRYTANVEKSVVIVEVYYFPADKSNDISKSVISQVEKSGEFKLENLYTVPVKAILSKSKEILVIYDDKAIENTANKEAYEKVKTILNQF